MPAEENKAIIRRIWKGLMKGNLEITDECFTENSMRYAHDGTTMDLQSFKNYCSIINKDSPRVTIDDTIDEGDKVACRIASRNTDRNPSI